MAKKKSPSAHARKETIPEFNARLQTNPPLFARYTQQYIEQKAAGKSDAEVRDMLWPLYPPGIEKQEIGEDARELAKIKRRLRKACQGRSAPMDKQLEWAYKNAGVAWRDIDPDTIPDAGALTLLEHMKGSESVGFTQFVVKQLSVSTSKRDTRRRYADRESDILDTLERARTAHQAGVLPLGAQGPDRQYQVAEDAG